MQTEGKLQQVLLSFDHCCSNNNDKFRKFLYCRQKNQQITQELRENVIKIVTERARICKAARDGHFVIIVLHA